MLEDLIPIGVLALAGAFSITWRVLNKRRRYVPTKGSPQEQLELANRSIASGKASADSYVARGNAYDELGLLDRALGEYDRALQMSPKSASALRNRGVALLRAERFDEAVIDLTAALQADPQYVSALLSRAASYSLLQQHDQAIADLKCAAAIEPRDATIAYMLGVALVTKMLASGSTGNETQARLLMTETLGPLGTALRLNKRYPAALELRARIWAGLGDFGKALRDINQLIGVNPENEAAHQLRNEIVPYLNTH